MRSPQKRPMTDRELKAVSNILSDAFDDGISLDSPDAVIANLKGMLSEDLLLSCRDEILGCCFRLRAERSNPPHSPPVTDSQYVKSDTSQEGDDRSENSEPGSPSFVSEDSPVMISFFCPFANEYRLVSMRACKGKVSYISDAFARQQLGAGPKPSILLDWSNVGSGSDFARTRCELIHRDFLSNCELALAEDHEKNDSDFVDGGLAGEEQNIHDRSIGASGSPGVTACPGFPTEDDPEVLDIAAKMNLRTAIELVNSKRKFQPLATFEVTQHKRIRQA